jgi:hypothetical protein
MPDIKEIAAACANRIMDRMELCRGSAILKSDIEREVEAALREMIGAPKATPASIADKALKALADAHTPEFSGVDFGVPYSGFRFRVEGDTLIHEPIPLEEMYDTEHDEHLGPVLTPIEPLTATKIRESLDAVEPFRTTAFDGVYQAIIDKCHSIISERPVDPPELNMTATEVRERLKESFKGKRNP